MSVPGCSTLYNFDGEPNPHTCGSFDVGGSRWKSSGLDKLCELELVYQVDNNNHESSDM